MPRDDHDDKHDARKEDGPPPRSELALCYCPRCGGERIEPGTLRDRCSECGGTGAVLDV